MPQIQILPAAPGFGSQLGQALGQGLGAGIQQGISARLNNMLQTKKELGRARPSVMSFLKRYGKDHGYSPDAITGIEDRTKDLINEGYSADDASQAAFQEYNQSLPPVEPQKGFFEKHFAVGKEANREAREKALSGLKKFGQDTKTAAAKFGYPFVGHAQAIKNLFSPDNAVVQDLRRQGYSEEEIASSLEAIQGALPSFLQTNPKDLTESYLEATGGIGPGENKVERAIQGALGTFHPAGAIGQVVAEAAEEAGAPPVVQGAADILGFLAALKFGPQAWKNLRSFKANKKVLEKAEQMAAKTGQKVEEVFQKAQEEGGVNLAKAAEGDAAEINKLKNAISKEAPPIAEKVKAAPKTTFNVKQAAKEREVFGAKLPEHPFEEYYAVEGRKTAKEAAKTAPTRAKEAAITARVQPQLEAKYTQLAAQRKELEKLEQAAKPLTGRDKARVDGLAAFKRNDIEKTLGELRDLQYELKYFRPRPTDAQMAAEAEKSAKELVQQIKNPTETSQKAIQKGLEADKKILDAAEKTMARGELPGEIRPDTYLRIQEKYLEAYKAQVEQLREANRALKGAKDAQSLKELADNRKAIKHLEHRARVQKAKIANQRDKIKAMRAIEGPSGAFYRQQLKTTQNTVAEFQKDFFKQPKVKSELQQKTQKVAKKEFQNAQKVGEHVGKNPTEANIKKGAEITGESPSKLKQTLQEVEQETAKLKAGKATEKDIQQTERIFTPQNFKDNLTSAGRHFLVGALTGILEESLDIKIPRYALYGTAAVVAPLIKHPLRSPGRFVGFSAGHHLVNYVYNQVEASKLRALKNNPNQRAVHIQNLRKRYSSQRVNKIIEKSK